MVISNRQSTIDNRQSSIANRWSSIFDSRRRFLDKDAPPFGHSAVVSLSKKRLWDLLLVAKDSNTAEESGWVITPVLAILLNTATGG